MRPLVLVLCLIMVLGAGEEAPRPNPWQAQHAPAPGFFDLVGGTISTINQDGTVDAERFAAELRTMNEAIGRQLIQRPDKADGSTVAAQADPIGGEQGWRLWVFWSVDAPECAGLGSELIRLRATGLVHVRAVHLAGLRHWEDFLWRMEDYRSRILGAAKAKDQASVQAIWLAWKNQVEPINAIIEAFHGRVQIIPDTRAAIALKVRSVPTFRLVSPARRIHALDGFTPETSLIDWVQKVQAWEAQQP